MNICNILTNSLQDKWPDLIVEMHIHNETIYYRADSKMFCYSQSKSSMGRYCGKRHDVILKVKNRIALYRNPIHEIILFSSRLDAHILVLIVVATLDVLI